MSKQPLIINDGERRTDFGTLLDNKKANDVGFSGRGQWMPATDLNSAEDDRRDSKHVAPSVADDGPGQGDDEEKEGYKEPAAFPAKQDDEEDQDYDLEQGSRVKFRESQIRMRQTIQGQTEGYGKSTHVKELETFFNTERHRLTLANQAILTPFIDKYALKLEDLKTSPNPSAFVSFLEEQKRECDAADLIAQPELEAFLNRETDYLLSAIRKPEKEEAKEQETCWFWTKNHSFHLTGAISVAALTGMIIWMAKALTYSSNMVTTSGDYAEVLARLANQAAEENHFSHNTLVAAGLGLASGVFTLGVFAGYQIVKHWVKAPLEKEVRGLRSDITSLRLQIQDVRMCIQHTPVPKPHADGVDRPDKKEVLGGGRNADKTNLQFGPVKNTIFAEKGKQRLGRVGDEAAAKEKEARDRLKKAPQSVATLGASSFRG